MNRLNAMLDGAYHRPVLVSQVISYLQVRPGGVYVDATFGGGGHTQAILDAEPTCRVIAFDWDMHALDNGGGLKEKYGERLELIWGNFADLTRLFKKHKLGKVDGVLADFGTSQFQILTAPGFSFSVEAPLDMRMSPAHSAVTAADFVNKASERELSDIFFNYGEERYSRQIAREICSVRRHKTLKTTGDLVAIVLSVYPKSYRGIHPATRVFQALRIIVNKELENIESFLKALPLLLVPGGRVVCISFHSLEDRLVKQFVRNNDEFFVNITPKVVVADQSEVSMNRSSRSAKLRAFERRLNGGAF